MRIKNCGKERKTNNSGWITQAINMRKELYLKLVKISEENERTLSGEIILRLKNSFK